VTDELIAFLRARLDDEERLAKAALWAGDERWQVLPGQEQPFRRPWQVIDATYEEGLIQVRAHAADDEGVSRFIAHNDPVRRLAEVEAKRRILDRYEHLRQPSPDADSTAMGRWGVLMNEYDLRILPALAQPYATHPEFRPEWKTT
jgi:hypothetical protein